MYFFRKQIAILLIVVACCTLTISCSDSRAVQCTKFTEIVNKGNALIAVDKDSNDAATTENLATNLNLIAKELEDLRITDPSLKEIQNPSVKSFQEISQALGDISKSLQAGNLASTSIEGRVQIQTAQADIIRAGQQANQAAENQDALTDKLLNYCKTTS
ncbi:hypothetical protein AVDCRST_MAG84-919 [uncultured Microcoleus sp.]|uniref:Uncharacterized protein n=1 Tax=uncultured Microcoleus sp. TaxID=259945 RepID=A0A6J4KSP6_9CYAN|nr:hypothetical protein AVDCRST_MAG84-919 [uncultured Microcoleus sp.]